MELANNQQSQNINLSDIEKEVSILLSTRKSIKSMVNKSMVLIAGDQVNGVTVKPNDMHNATLFSILLVDFISPINPTFGKFRSHVEALKYICSKPNFNFSGSISELEKSVNEFDAWLIYEAVFEKVWLPSAFNEELVLKMKREEFLRICGDISKHNQLRLSTTAKRILDILQRSNPNLNLSSAFSAIEEFYEWFHTDVFYYHFTKICELLNNIAWGIQTYLMDEYNRSYTVDLEKSCELKLTYYEFQYPSAVTSPLGKYHYWELMNEIRAKPYIDRFKAWKYLEGRY